MKAWMLPGPMSRYPDHSQLEGSRIHRSRPRYTLYLGRGSAENKIVCVLSPHKPEKLLQSVSLKVTFWDLKATTAPMPFPQDGRAI